MSAKKVIGKLGGLPRASQILGIDKAVIRHWCNSGRIPDYRREEIKERARLEGVVIVDNDFIGEEPFKYRDKTKPVGNRTVTKNRRFIHMRTSETMRIDLALVESKYPKMTLTQIFEMLLHKEASWHRKERQT